ncbi:DUF4268 domain-containing protein [Spongiactinospora gelatinilytica]|uniref:DUF4268 domain-containing protein n=1 Tax=Spongiactinospora gelatinilytica TaxID=2666298 RepID=UPI00131485E6|nr:DUF4268 domain-containing protein [Spongiactinospora gelatinilytica]
MPAPLFRVVVQPNDRRKRVKQAGPPAVAGRNLAYQQFWERFIERARSQRPGWTRARKPPAQNWFDLPAGVTGIYYGVSFSWKKLRSEPYLGGEAAANDRVLAVLQADREALGAAYGGLLIYEPLPDKIACRIAVYRPGSIEDTEDWDAYLDWFVDSQTRLRKALDAHGGISALYQRGEVVDAGGRADRGGGGPYGKLVGFEVDDFGPAVVDQHRPAMGRVRRHA